MEENELKVTVPDLSDKAVRKALKTHPMWQEYNSRCISCGACTVACSTCTCFTTRDIIYGDNPEVGERRRVTASCQISGFDQMAGQREFRSTAADRMRYKVLHKFHDYKARFGEEHMCVGCGECVRVCPTSAWTRQETKFYRVILGGRTGRQTPRTGKMFLNWATEDVILGVLKNWQKFSAWVMDYKPEYLHGGHLIDRAGYKKFKEIILDGVELNPECLVAEDLYWHETEYRSNFNVKPLSMHHTAGPKE